ncbi:hemerythrin domain-containing protein [Castellaniella caeni]
MPDSAAPAPIETLLQAHARTRALLRTLAAWAAQAPAVPAPPMRRRDELIAWFDGPAPAQHHLLDDVLFPAFIESMAGSDAVCLKGMTQGLSAQGARLQHRWHGTIRAQLMAAAPMRDTIVAWAEDYVDYLQRADEELLPMAERLLDDDAMARLREACAALPPWIGGRDDTSNDAPGADTDSRQP